MNDIDDFISHVEKEDAPSSEWSELIQALWWAKKGKWEKSHDLAQEIESEDGSWVHAYLHRVEGDVGNAGYWYRRANKEPKTNEDLDVEWKELAQYFLLHG
ncbi:hypothetical protein N8920_04885 [Opitutales bacterium]|jgi:hypothetical protein|nr:hypothetical protein [Opitutales bacterium]MDA8991023.1 hypothetical protein [Opitutales bacterium]